MRSNLDSDNRKNNIPEEFELHIQRFIAHIDIERGLSKKTVSAYASDLQDYT